MDLLKTSVVIATKNNIGTIDRCLSSLVPYHKQGYISEIVIVDGHSTDGTLEVIKEYPVKLLFDEGTTYSEARETGWRNAGGELLAFLDSDAYLEGNFFPEVYKFFDDERMGIIGCQPKAVVTNRLTRAIAEQWEWGTAMLGASLSRFQRLNRWIATNKFQILPGGPCQIARRICLEAVNGFPRHKHQEDLYLSQRIIAEGWKTAWWVDAPLYHYPRDTFKGLIKQGYKWGNDYRHSELLDKTEMTSDAKPSKVTFLISRLASLIIGLMLAIRFRNPLHLIVYPLPRYAWVIGYIIGYVKTKNRRGLYE